MAAMQGLADVALAGSTVPGPRFLDASSLTFVQITDAHLFDAGKRAPTAQAASNLERDSWDALHWAIQQTNRLVDAGTDISFVVFTGDLGLDLVRSFGEKPCNGSDEREFEKLKQRG